jgi:type II secretory pathway pseudopilin PulG
MGSISRVLREGRGHTIEEVLVAVTILAVATVGMMGAFTAGLTTAGRSQQMTRATAWVTRQMEEVRDRAFAAITDQTFPNPTQGFQLGEIDRTDISADLIRVDVRLYRQSADANSYYSTSTYVTRR